MADYRTYADIKSEVQQDTDTEAETFVDNTQFLTWCNSGLNQCEAHIHKLGLEDNYFLKRQDYDLVSGQSDITLPTDIYANKIKALIFDNGSDLYPIRRLRGDQKFIHAQELDREPRSRCSYRYLILNEDPTVGPFIRIFPTSIDTGTGIVKMRYVRNVLRVTADTDRIDVPEFYSYVKAYMKYKVYNKEGSPMAADAKGELEEEKILMIQTLENMVPDEDNRIPGDYSWYEEMS